MEIETKVLEIDRVLVAQKLRALGASEVQNVRLIVDWYSPADILGDTHPWYLRVRSFGEEKAEISWKSLPKIIGNTRHSEEITVPVSDFETAKSILDALGFKNYAHQEKDRLSFVYKAWNFDIDQYPGMPCYLEIEGNSYEHVQEAILLLNLENHESISEGERLLIEEKYKLNWSDMRF
jgi:adenylate cyclase class 2